MERLDEGGLRNNGYHSHFSFPTDPDMAIHYTSYVRYIDREDRYLIHSIPTTCTYPFAAFLSELKKKADLDLTQKKKAHRLSC